MSKQKGQSMVEFAFIVPGLIFIFLGLVYGGILFMDYIQYNNAARAIARAAAFSPEKDFDAAALKQLEDKYFNPLTSLYNANIKEIDPLDGTAVKVTIEFTRNEHLKLFSLLTSDTENAEDKIEFPPQKLKDIVFIMPIEQNSQE